MTNLWTEILGLVAGFIGVFIAYPQLTRVIRLKFNAGVSLWTWLIITFSNLAWIGYGIRFESISQIITNICAATITGALTFILLRAHVNVVLAVLIVLATWAVALLSILLEPVYLVSIEIMIGLTSRLPQVGASFVSWREGRASAVSWSSNWMAIIASALWVLYAFITQLWTIAYFSGSVIVFSALVLAFEAGARRRAVAMGHSLTPES